MVVHEVKTPVEHCLSLQLGCELEVDPSSRFPVPCHGQMGFDTAKAPVTSAHSSGVPPLATWSVMRQPGEKSESGMMFATGWDPPHAKHAAD